MERSSWLRVASCELRDDAQLGTRNTQLLRRRRRRRGTFDDTSLLLLADHDGDRIASADRGTTEGELADDDAVRDARIGFEFHRGDGQAVAFERRPNAVERLIDE